MELIHLYQFLRFSCYFVIAAVKTIYQIKKCYLLSYGKTQDNCLALRSTLVSVKLITRSPLFKQKKYVQIKTKLDTKTSNPTQPTNAYNMMLLLMTAVCDIY